MGAEKMGAEKMGKWEEGNKSRFLSLYSPEFVRRWKGRQVNGCSFSQYHQGCSKPVFPKRCILKRVFAILAAELPAQLIF